jgi:hypothetical protein
MAAPKRKINETGRYGEEWRLFLRDILRSRVRTREAREQIAKRMGTSTHYVNSMLYRLDGGLDAWATALSVAFDLKPKDLKDFFMLLRTLFRQVSPISEADKVWARLDEDLNENDKHYWITLLQALIIADKEFKKQK